MRIASNGNIGIGTTNPFSTLHLHANATTADVRMVLSDNTSTAGAGKGLHIMKYSDNQAYIWNYENTAMMFATNALERMRIASNGNIGIGTNNPASILDVVSATSIITIRDSANGNGKIYFGNSGHGVGRNAGISTFTGGNDVVLWTAGDGSVGFCTGSTTTERLRIASNGNVVIGGNLNVGSLTNPSDSRIKKDIEDINDDTALNKILLIQPTTYNYIDEERNKGFGKVYGFIAQQIREVIPEAVPIIETTTPIPNIYNSCLIHNKREVYYSIPFDTPIDTSVKIDDLLYKIKEIYEDYFVIDKDIEAVEAFVYGYNIEDFHTLDKTYIFTLNVCATQELHRRIEAQNVGIKSHEDRIKDLEMKIERMLSGTT
jgi:hypothetical protein